jgi:hypothetical protein
VAGVPVPDSCAAARINANGDVVEEDVYWPSLPTSVLGDAQNLLATFADPVKGPTLRAKLPTELQSGQLAIRHSPGGQNGTFQAVAVYDMEQPGPLPRTRHFDMEGNEVTMMHEVALHPLSTGLHR